MGSGVFVKRNFFIWKKCPVEWVKMIHWVSSNGIWYLPLLPAPGVPNIQKSYIITSKGAVSRQRSTPVEFGKTAF